MKPKFLNVDLEIKSSSRLLQIEKEFEEHLARNPASGRVMEKTGMTKEGLLRDYTYRWGKHEDLVVYGILSSD